MSGRSIVCPDCDQSLLLEQDTEGRLRAERAPSSAPVQTAKRFKFAVNWQHRLSQLRQLAANPVVVAWSLAGGGTLLLLLSILTPLDQPSSAPTPAPPDKSSLPTPGPRESSDNMAESDNALPNEKPHAPPVDPQESPQVTAVKPEPQEQQTAPETQPPVAPPSAGSPTVATPTVATPADTVPPTAKPAVGEATAQTPQPDPVDDPPAAAKPEPTEPAIDIPSRLTQVILEFDQATPLVFAQHITQIEEFLGVPIRIAPEVTDQSPEALKRKISLQQKQTTVGKILNAVVSKAGLGYEIRKNHILILPAAQE